MMKSKLSDNSEISFDHLEEKQWVRSIRENGDQLAFEKLYRNYYKRLHGYAYSYLKRAQDAEDIVQTVFLRIWAQKEIWNPPGAVKHYLFAAVRNEALNVLRHEQVVNDAEDEIARIIIQSKIPTPSDEDSGANDLKKAIQEGINRLPPQCRQIYMLNRKSGLTYSEIAEDLEISVNTVGTQMGRALKSLRKYLSDFLVYFITIGPATMIF